MKKSTELAFDNLMGNIYKTLPVVDQMLRDAAALDRMLRDHPMSVTTAVEELREVCKHLHLAHQKLQNSQYMPHD